MNSKRQWFHPRWIATGFPSINHPTCDILVNCWDEFHPSNRRFILMQCRWNGFIPFNAGQHLQQNSKTWSESWCDLIEMNARTQWDSSWPVNTKYRDEYPRPMGFTRKCSPVNNVKTSMQIFLAPRWIPASNGVHSRGMPDLNSRVQWGSLPGAPASSSELGNGIGNAKCSLSWTGDEFPRPMGFILVRLQQQCRKM